MGLVFLLLFLYWTSTDNWKRKIVLWAPENEDKDGLKSEHRFFLLSVYHDSRDILDAHYVLA